MGQRLSLATLEKGTAMTILTEVLVRHAIYNHYGIFRIAISDDTLQDLTGNDTFQVSPQQVTLTHAPGTPEWVDRMVQTRTALVHTYTTLQNEHDGQTRHLEGLGEALLEKAVEKEWCSEYDDFAEEWDLPRRLKEWEVIVRVQVNARTEEDALTLVRSNVGLERDTENLIEGPEFTAEEV